MCVKGVILNRDINGNLNSREQMLNWKKFFIFMVCEGGMLKKLRSEEQRLNSSHNVASRMPSSA